MEIEIKVKVDLSKIPTEVLEAELYSRRSNSEGTDGNEEISYCEFLKQKRESLGISIRGLALKIDLSRSYISTLENNQLKNIPTRKSLKEIIKGYKLNEKEIKELHSLMLRSSLENSINKAINNTKQY